MNHKNEIPYHTEYVSYLVCVFVWDLDPMIYRVCRAELLQDVASGDDDVHLLHFGDGRSVVGEAGARRGAQ